MAKITGGNVNPNTEVNVPSASETIRTEQLKGYLKDLNPKDIPNDIPTEAETQENEADKAVMAPSDEPLSAVPAPIYDAENLGVDPYSGNVNTVDERISMGDNLNPKFDTWERTGTIPSKQVLADEAARGVQKFNIARPAIDSTTNMLARADQVADRFLKVGGDGGPESNPIKVGGVHLTTQADKDMGIRDVIAAIGRGEVDNKALKPFVNNEARKNTLASTMHVKLDVSKKSPDGTYSFDPAFGRQISLSAENEIDQAFIGTPADADPFSEEGEIRYEEGDFKSTPKINPMDSADKIGKSIETWWGRHKRDTEGVEVDPLTPAERKDLGAAAFQTYVAANPTFFEVVEGDAGGIAYKLTPMGEVELQASREIRQDVFNVKRPPLKSRPEKRGGLSGDLAKEAPRYKSSAQMGGKVGVRQIDESIDNQNRVTHVVDHNRLRISSLFLLPALFAPVAREGIVFADAFGIGEKSYISAFERDKRDNGNTPDKSHATASSIIVNKKRDLAKQLKSIIENIKGPNYMTFTSQTLAGRMMAQQSDFNATRSKLVRYVTRSKTPAVIQSKSGRLYKNLMNIYALNFGADEKLEAGRMADLEDNKKKYADWGKYLDEAVNRVLPKELYLDIMNNIRDNGQMPQMSPLLEFEKSLPEDLLLFLKKKGEDGPAAAEALIDFYKFHKNMDEGRPHTTFLNGYIDGKTNGIANQGAMLGIKKIGMFVGMLRDDNSEYALNDNKDIRSAMAEIIDNHMESEDFVIPSEHDAYKEKLREALHYMGTKKEINKPVSMVFPYGKDIENMGSEIKKVIPDLIAEDPAFGALLDDLYRQGLKEDDLVEMAKDNVAVALYELFGDLTFKTRAIMRNAGYMAAVMDKIFSIPSPMGHTINLGGKKLRTGDEFVKRGKVEVSTPGLKISPLVTQTSESYMSSAASKPNADGKPEIAGYARGRSSVIPTQSMDAATMVKTTTGKSWQKLVDAHPDGDPYFFQIYDAAKVDVHSFDVLQEEINQNWADITLTEYNFLEHAKENIENTYKEFMKTLEASPGAVWKTGVGEQFDFVGSLFEKTVKFAGTDKEVVSFPLLESFCRSAIPRNKNISSEEHQVKAKQMARQILRELFPTVTKFRDIPRPTQISSERFKVLMKVLMENSLLLPKFDKLINESNSNRKELRAEFEAQKRRTGVGARQFNSH